LKQTMTVMTFLLLIAALLPLACVQPNHPAPRPTSQWQSLSDDGAWCWYSDPRAVYHDDKTFAAWVSSKGDVTVSEYDHRKNDFDSFVLHANLEIDDHDVPSILVRNDGHILAFYSRHSKDDYYLRISQKPGDISTWQPVKRLYLNDNDEYPDDFRRTYCYSNPYQLSEENGRIFLFWRGIDHKPNYSISDDGGQTWSKGRIVISPGDTYKNQRPYVKYASNNKNRIHLAFTDGHPRNEPTNGIYYVCYRDGAFYHADGSKIKTLDEIPLDSREVDIVYDARSTQVRAWIWDVAEDDKGYPVIVYTRLPADTDHRPREGAGTGHGWSRSVSGAIRCGHPPAR